MRMPLIVGGCQADELNRGKNTAKNIPWIDGGRPPPPRGAFDVSIELIRGFRRGKWKFKEKPLVTIKVK